jgi:2-methylcitrate dehydratase PrpD
METRITHQLAEFVAETSAADIPEAVLHMASLCLLDWTGAAVAGSREPIARVLESSVRQVDHGNQAAVIGSGYRYSAPHAAMINGTLSHVLELDDVHHGAAIHGSAVVWAAVLAAAQWTGASAAQATAAFCVGYETMARVGVACGLRMIQNHHHPTGVLGYLGAAAACGRMFGLDTARQAMAFGIAAGQAGALTQVRGTMSKSFFAGHSAHGGMMSALMAGEGFLSAPDSIEGPEGVLATFGTRDLFSGVVEGLGQRWELEQNAFKVHASCAMSHALIDGVLELRNRHSIEHSAVETVSLRLYPHASEYLDRSHIEGGLAGKFSAQYSAAVALMDGQAHEGQFTDERAADQRLASLMKRVRVSANPAHALDQASVDITMADGRVFRSEVQAVLGSPARALSRTELEAKFGQLASKALGADSVERLLGALRSWPNYEVEGLMRATQYLPQGAEEC